MFNKTTSKKNFAPRRQARKDFINLLTAETQSTLREEVFAQSGDDVWAKGPVLREACFCLSSSRDKQKKKFSATSAPLRWKLWSLICVNLRESAVNFWAFCVFPRVIFFRFRNLKTSNYLCAVLKVFRYFLRTLRALRLCSSPRGVLALVETIQLGRAVTPQGESSYSRQPVS